MSDKTAIMAALSVVVLHGLKRHYWFEQGRQGLPCEAEHETEKVNRQKEHSQQVCSVKAGQTRTKALRGHVAWLQHSPQRQDLHVAHIDQVCRLAWVIGPHKGKPVKQAQRERGPCACEKDENNVLDDRVGWKTVERR